MPRIGRKKKLRRDVDYLFLFRILQHIISPPDPRVLQKLTVDYITQCEIVSSFRYAADRVIIPKVKTWYNDILPSLGGRRFRQQLRMNQSTFKHVASIIKGI